jgi:hypothetical protein
MVGERMDGLLTGMAKRRLLGPRLADVNSNLAGAVYQCSILCT